MAFRDKVPQVIRQIRPPQWRDIRAGFKRQIPALAGLTGGLALTVAAVFTAAGIEERESRQQFDSQAEHNIEVVGRAIDRSLALVNAAGGIFSGTQGASRWTFYDYVQQVRPLHPGLRRLQWLPRIAAANRLDFELRAQKDDGLTGFRILDRDARSQMIPAAPRDEYYPAAYIEPFDGNENLLGEDFLALPAYGVAMAAARDDGHMVTILQRGIDTPTGPQIGLLVFRPVFHGGVAPDTPEERRKAIAGYVAGLFLVSDTVDAAMREYTTPSAIDIELRDDSSALGDERPTPGLVYRWVGDGRNGTSVTDAGHEGPSATSTLTVADRTWTINAHGTARATGDIAGYTVWLTGLSGLALTAMLALYLAAMTNRNRAIEYAVEARTSELSAANESLYREIRRRRRIEDELRRARDAAEVANRTKSAFLAMVSHELRTPLNAIIGFSEIMRESIFGPVGDRRYKGYLEDIGQSGQHLLGLINNILDLSKVEANEFSLHEEVLDMPALVAETLRLFVKTSTEPEHDITVDVAPDLPRLRGDERAIRQILVNLLSNAVKFTPKGGTITVRLTLDRTGRITLAVADSGIGIAREDMDRVFQPFTQVDSSLARRYEGTGLGLPLAKNLASLHDAEIEMKSRPKRGTTVSVTFPAGRTLPAETGMAAELPA